ncbi:MAG: GNAT family N-acetyltransferase [Burkholderiales bacterium]|nr:GNAT family N-acetyltransferase [Burkholderiales bacterium]
MTAPFRLEVLGPGHAREAFRCGVEALDRYFARQAGQDVRRRVSACYVAVESGSGKVAGYYTLAAGGVPLTDLPAELAKRLPRYPSVPVARVGRLAVDRGFHGRKLGSALLADAALRAARSEVSVFALIVDAKDDAAVAFYRHHGFEPFGGNGRQLVVSLERFGRMAG